jgi:hypothetical protein
MATEDYWLTAGPEQQMLLLLGRVCDEWGGPAHRRLVQATCEFVRRAVTLLPPDDPRPRAILSIVEEWAAGDHTITRDDLGRAADSADEAAETMYHAPEPMGWHYPAAYAVCCAATAASDDGSAAVGAAVDALRLAGRAYRHFHGD